MRTWQRYPRGGLLVSVADKLQSLRELWRQVRWYGDEAYAGLVSGTLIERRDKTLWFQGELLKAWRSRLKALRDTANTPLLAGIEALILDFRECLTNLERARWIDPVAAISVFLEEHWQEIGALPALIKDEQILAFTDRFTPEQISTALHGKIVFCADCEHVAGANVGCDSCFPV